MGKDLKGKELGEGISQRKNGIYCARYHNRFGKRKDLYDKNLKSLKEKLIKARYEDGAELNLVDESVVLDDWFDIWTLTYKKDVVREGTLTTYNRVYRNQIKDVLGRFPISKITKLQVQSLINGMKEKGLSWEMQNTVRILLVDMFNRAMEDSFVRRNPAKGIRIATKEEQDRRVLTKEEQSDFLESSAGTFYHNLFVVAINTGLRPGELYALTWNDIDLAKKIITVSKTLVYQQYLSDDKKTFHLEPPKTTQSHRQVPINSHCEKALKRQYIQKRIISRKNARQTDFPDLLFTTKFNTPLNAVIYDDAITKIVAEINSIRDDADQFMRFSGHTFRHTFATRCIEAGIKPKTLQAYLGHANISMTMDLYVHTTDDHKFEEMNLLENELDKLCENDSTDEKFRKMIKEEAKIIDISKVKLA